MPIKVLSFIKNRGFTLLEILIALFIFTLVALIMAKSLHTILDSQEVTEKNAKHLRQIQLALLLFSRDLEQAINRPITNAQGTLEDAFLGSPTSLTLSHAGFSNPQGQLTTSTLQRSRYRFENGQLFRDIWDNLDQTSHSIPHRRILLTDIKALYFRYLDHKNVFHAYWPNQEDNTQGSIMPPRTQLRLTQGNAIDALPRAIEINITFNQGKHLQQTYLLPQQQVPHD